MTTVRPIVPADRDRWEQLYAGYAAFYETAQTPEMRERVWGWLLDPAHPQQGLVAVDESDRPIAIAHWREFSRPLAASTGAYLDDLFVDPDARGHGVAEAVIGELRRLGVERGWTLVRWITADDNHRAQRVYDRVATRTRWVTYDLTP